jgi:hypothetical protein
MTKKRIALVVLAAICCGFAPDWIPFKDRKTHQCGAVCACGCIKNGPCSCDGKRCQVDVIDPDGCKVVRVEVMQEDLPPRWKPCPNRPSKDGVTWYRDGYFWSCNDPQCFGCNP